MNTSTETLETQETSETSLLDQVMQETRIQPGDDGFETARRGVEAFITDLLANSKKNR
jgi:type VI secretion system protein ImpC